MSILSRVYCAPTNEGRTGCPCTLTPLCRITKGSEESRRELVHNYTMMKLQHISKTGAIKNELSLTSLHRDLEQASLLLEGSGSSNLLLTKLSFDCLIKTISGEEVRSYIHFDLKIPGTGTQKNPLFSYDMVEALYGGKDKLHAALACFYSIGRSIANPEDKTHGHKPKYDTYDSSEDQYIRHTEQLLVAYLVHPDASTMIANRLTSEIRGKYPEASEVKLYNMGIHMHSTKTCCAPCEYSLLGLMNDRDVGSFIDYFMGMSNHPNSILKFTFPEKSNFLVLTTVSASEHDADHRKEISYSYQTLDPKRDFSYNINVKYPLVTQHIFTAALFNKFDSRLIPDPSVLLDKTVGMSGSKQTKKNDGTVRQSQNVKDAGLSQITDGLSLLKLDG